MTSRYAGVRKQFGPSPGNELAILEYQTHQCRLFPHLASGLVYYVLGETLFKVRTYYDSIHSLFMLVRDKGVRVLFSDLALAALIHDAKLRLKSNFERNLA